MPSLLPYGPSWLPDELLYSWLGRLACLNSLGTPREAAERLFGSASVIPGIDLPSRLHVLLQRLGNRAPFALDELLDVGTLLPYHRPFLAASRLQAVLQSMTLGDGRGMKTMMGRVANRFGANPPLRSCDACDAESLEIHGSPYWARRHQLPGVGYCTRHRIRLRCQPELKLRTNPQRFILAPGGLPSAPPVQADELQFRFVQLSEELLAARLPCVDPHERATAYRRAADQMGFRGPRGRTDTTALAQSLRARFADFQGFEHRDRLLAPASQPLAWVRTIIERSERAVHPICHLLLIDFLFGSVASFAAALAEQPVEEPVVIEQASSSNRALSSQLAQPEEEALLRDPTISCRRVASLIDKSVTTVVVLRRARGLVIRERRKSLDETRLKGIRGDLALGHSPTQIAGRRDVSLSTVYRVRAEQYVRPRPDAAGQEREMAERKSRWLRMLSLHPDKGATQLRAAAPSDYAWLYQRDRAWLLSTTRSRRQPASPARTRLDWQQRDVELCQQAREHATALRQLLPPQRVTITRLLRPIGDTLVRHNWERLPRLQALLEEISESREAFALRVIDHAIDVVADARGTLALWRVKRHVGMRLWSSAMTRYAVEQIEKVRGQRPSSHIKRSRR